MKTVRGAALQSVRNFAFPAICGLGLLASSDRAAAQPYTWNPNPPGPSDGDGTWDTTMANFFNGTGNVGWVNGSNGVFGSGGAAGTVTIGPGGVSVGNLTFNAVSSGSYLIGGDTLTFTTGGLRTITSNVNASISASIVTAGAIATTGAGTLTLSGVNTAANFLVQGGSTTISGGSTSAGLLGVGYFGVAAGNGGPGNGTLNVTGGTVNVSAPGNTGDFSVGSGPGDVGALNFSAGTINVGDAASFGRMAVGAFGGSGTVNQSGGNLNHTGPMNIGSRGGTGLYNLSGGTLTIGLFPAAGDSNGLQVGARRVTGDGATSGTLNVSGSAQLLINDGALLVGGDTGSTEGGTGVVTQSGTSLVRLSNGFLSLGSGTNAATSNGTYNLNGGVLELGRTNGIQGGPGTANFNFGGGTLRVIGTSLTTNVAMNLTNSTSSFVDTNGLNATFSGNINGLRNSSTGGSLTKVGTGTLTFDGAGSRQGNNLKIGNGAVSGGVGGTITQTAGTTDFQYVAVGADAGSGTYNMNGGTLGGSGSDMTLHVGDFNGTGTFNQTAGLVQPGVSRSLNIGNRGGSGVYNLSGGQLVLNATSNLGRNAPADGTGGAAALGSSQGTLNLSGTGVLTLQGSAELVLSSRQETTNAAVADGSQGTINQTGGTLQVQGNSALFLGGAGNSTYNLTGGTLEVGGSGLRGSYFGTVGSYSFNLGGGTILVSGSALSTSVNANLNSGTYSVLNTNGLGANWSGNFTGSLGGLVKTGVGDLALSGTNVIASMLVAGGSVTQSAGTFSSNEVAVGTGAGNTASYTMNGGTLTLLPGTVAPIVGGPTAQSSLRVGDFAGTGTFTQNAGTVNVSGSLNVGNQGGSGTYNLAGGTLNLADGLYNLGRKANGTNTTSSGTLNISGGLLNVANGNFIIGSRDNGVNAAASSGVVNQTGGTFRVSGTTGGDNLFLAGFGSGTYNLNGGALEVGGNGLQGNYLGSTGAYSFNLGGGTLRAINSTLTTSVNATLTGSSTSTIDTNGVGATLSGSVSGTGSLTKSGPGTLVLTGSNTFSGRLTVNAGTVLANGTGAGALGGVTDIRLNAGGALTIGSGNSSRPASTDAILVATNQINAASTMTLNGGTFTIPNGDTTLGKLTLSADSIIDMAGATSVLLFANSSDVVWSGHLSIYNWNGQIIDMLPGGPMISGDPNEALFFGNSLSGLTPSQLASISFFSDAGVTPVGSGFTLGTNGQVIAVVPEPGTYAAAALTLLALGWHQRVRVRRWLRLEVAA